MNLQPVFDLVEICHLKGIRQAVISPGSRNAALTIAFARHPEIKCYSVPDERSAAFIALGMSLKTKVPTAIICTSGSAALNYSPAIAEAYFNQVPLLILTADRPPEWIGQRDGQTIYQEHVFGKHVKQSYVYPSLEEDKDSIALGHQMINEAINICLQPGMGPVHINIPFREPFYPTSTDKYEYNKNLAITNSPSGKPSNWTSELEELKNFNKILLVVGQGCKDDIVNKLLSELSTQYQIPIVADVISNAVDIKGVIGSQDVFLKGYDKDTLQPDLLITIGLSVISKNLKLYLRKHKPKAHWHVRNEAIAPDTYLALSKHLPIEAKDFLGKLKEQITTNNSQTSFYSAWQEIDTKTKKHIDQFDTPVFSDFKCYKKVMDVLPNGSDLHLANSMAVRYANVVGLKPEQNIEVYCNRGTSGIDGSNSTAVGTALMTEKPTFLLTGDMAFLYDRNAFWHNHLPNNLSIVVFNNHGGGIFRMIDGPSQQPELEEFFETRQQRDARLLAEEFDFDYLPCRNEEELDKNLQTFLQSGKRTLLEIFTDAEASKQAYKELFKQLQ